MNRSHRHHRRSRRGFRTLHVERLEARLPMSVNVSGEVFWDANRNGINDDQTAAPSGMSIGLSANPGQALQVSLTGSSVPYSFNNVDDESIHPSGAKFDVADIDALVGAGFQLTSPVSNNNDSTRSYAADSSVPVSKPSWVEAADLDGVNGPDLLVASYATSKLTVLLNNGAGVFTTRHEFEVGEFPTTIVTTDVNNDELIDVVVGNLNTRSLDVFVNNGTDTLFGAPLTLDAGSKGPFSVVAADVNDDGRPDLVSSNQWDQSVSVFLNESSGAEVAFVRKEPFSTGSNGTTHIVAVDLKGQPGLPSLVLLDLVANAPNRLIIFDNNGDGTFSFGGEATRTIEVGEARFISAVRLDNDVYDDLIVHDPTIREVRVYFGNGSGSFASDFAAPKTVWFPRGIDAADMDGDGDNDIVANLTQENPPVILRNDGNRSFADTIPLVDAPLEALVTSPPALADFNRDNVVDIAYSPKWLGGLVKVSLRKLEGGQQVVRTVNKENRDYSLSGVDFGVHRVVNAASTAAGDYDGSGTVDQMDYEVWKANYGRTAGPGMSADGNGSGRVDASDYVIWRNNRGTNLAAAAGDDDDDMNATSASHSVERRDDVARGPTDMALSVDQLRDDSSPTRSNTRRPLISSEILNNDLLLVAIDRVTKLNANHSATNRDSELGVFDNETEMYKSTLADAVAEWLQVH